MPDNRKLCIFTSCSNLSNAAKYIHAFYFAKSNFKLYLIRSKSHIIDFKVHKRRNGPACAKPWRLFSFKIMKAQTAFSFETRIL